MLSRRKTHALMKLEAQTRNLCDSHHEDYITGSIISLKDHVL